MSIRVVPRFEASSLSLGTGFFLCYKQVGGVYMKKQLEAIRKEAIEKIRAVDLVKDLEQLRVTYLGKKGSLTSVLRGMGQLSKEERPVIGQLANEVRETITQALEEKNEVLEKQALEKRLAEETIDVTLPG